MTDRVFPDVGDWVAYHAHQRGAVLEHVGRIIATSPRSVRVERLGQRRWVPREDLVGWWPRGTKGKTLEKRRLVPG